MRAVAIVEPGPGYRLEIEDRPMPVPGPGQVLIRVAGAGINRADMSQAMGQYRVPHGASDIPGLEVAGEIEAVGQGVEGWARGDKVCALLPGGGYAEFAVASAGCLLAVPPGIDLVEVGGLPEGLLTVWANVFEAAQLKPGESVLIHGGASGMGALAIQMCAALGHEVFATAGSGERVRACEALGAKRAINHRTEDFVEILSRERGEKGIDVVMDMVGGDYIQRNIAVAAHGGRIVNIAYQNGFEATVNFRPMLTKHVSLLATTLRSRSIAEKARLSGRVRQEIWPAVVGGSIKPVTDRVFTFAQAQAAHDHVRTGNPIGKVILAP